MYTLSLFGYHLSEEQQRKNADHVARWLALQVASVYTWHF
jgi:hypothetical protein